MYLQLEKSFVSPKYHHFSLLRDHFLDPSSSPYTLWLHPHSNSRKTTMSLYNGPHSSSSVRNLSVVFDDHDSECRSTTGFQWAQKGPWLPFAAHIKFKTLMLVYKTALASAPSCLHSLFSRSLGTTSERCLEIPSQRGTISLSRTFSLTVPGWWNDLPSPIHNIYIYTICFLFTLIPL